MPFTEARLFASNTMAVLEDPPKLAVSVGTAAGLQFVAVFQSLVAG
jgi:hypothetical protein